MFLKNISSLKHLKSLNVTISCRSNDEHFDAQKLGHILEIIKKFPMNSEIVIADMDSWWPNAKPSRWPNDLTNLIEKKGEDPKIVYGLSPDSRS